MQNFYLIILYLDSWKVDRSNSAKFGSKDWTQTEEIMERTLWDQAQETSFIQTIGRCTLKLRVVISSDHRDLNLEVVDNQVHTAHSMESLVSTQPDQDNLLDDTLSDPIHTARFDD